MTTKLITLKPTPLVPLTRTPVQAHSSTGWRAAALASNLLNLFLAAAMLLFAIRADQMSDRQEALALELSKVVVSIATMTSELVVLQHRANELQGSPKAEDKLQLTSIEQEIIRLTEQLRLTTEQLAIVIRRPPIPSSIQKRAPPAPSYRPGCGFDSNNMPIFCN